MDIAYKLLDLVVTIIEVFMYFAFIDIFVGQEIFKKQFNKVLGLGIFYTISIFCYTMLSHNDSMMIKGLFSVALIIVTEFLIYKGYYVKIIVMSVTYLIILSLIDFSTVVVTAYLSAQNINHFMETIFFKMFGALISKAILAVFILYAQRCMKNLKRLTSKYLFVLLILTAFEMFFTFYIFDNLNPSHAVTVSDAAIFIVLLMLELLFLMCFDVMTDNYTEKERIALVSLHNRMLQKSLDEEKVSFNLWRGRIHDYKNHVIYMRELLENKKYEELDEYLEKEAGELKKQSAFVQSGYIGIDAILNAKMVYAQSQNIHVFCNVSLPKGLNLDDGVMSSVLGNLLDNAIRAVMELEEKFIEVDIRYTKENLYLKVVNNKKEGTIDFEKSSKKNSLWHGIGIKSVRQQIENAGGDFKLIQEDKKVTAIAVIYQLTTEN